MKRLSHALIVCAVLLCSWVAAEEAKPMHANPQVEERVRKIASELRCLVCQNESIADSPADLAQDLRRQIREMVHAGKSEGEIMDYMVARYGQFVRYRPAFAATTVALWLGPFLVLLVALGWFHFFLRRQQARLLQEGHTLVQEEHTLVQEEHTLVQEEHMLVQKERTIVGEQQLR